ncbi:hypothetical protein BT67DRAFT_359356, partial [Trichocladium antarcticum]
MPIRRAALWVASLSAIYVSASTIPAKDLFARQSSCAPSFNQCNSAGFPDYFCCPAGQFCIPLAANTTLLCCPNAADCKKIKPVPCDITLQDGETNPDAVVKTTALGGALGRCGTSGCCPFGYTCSGAQECVRDENQNVAPVQTNTAEPRPTSPASPTPSATESGATTTTPSTTSSAESQSTTSNPPGEASGSSRGPSVAAIAGGATAGAVVLIGAAILAFIFLRKRKGDESKSPPTLSRSTSSFGNLISHPILQETTVGRTDFARGPGPRDPGHDSDSMTGALVADSTNPPMEMAAAPAAAALGPNRQSGIAYGYGGPELSGYVDMPYVDPDNGGRAPETPRQYREPSSNSMNIDIFAHPDITPDRTPESNADRRYTDMTTFTQMLDKADLGDFARGELFVPHQPGGGHPP